MRSARVWAALMALLGVLGSGSAARAADLYVAGQIGISSGEGDATSRVDFGPAVLGNDADKDASPLAGAALGIAVPLSDVIPWSLRFPSFDMPYWPGRALHFEGSDDFRFPGWSTLIEVEYVGLRNYDFETDSGAAGTPFHSEVSSHAFMGNLRLDLPVHGVVNALVGRVPWLEPLTLYVGGGAGVGWNEIEASGPQDLGSDRSFDFAYQYGAGFGYAISDITHLSLGWRRIDLGNVELENDSDAAQRRFDADVTAHEAVFSLRFHYYHIPFFGRE
jgi:hypothetical protein